MNNPEILRPPRRRRDGTATGPDKLRMVGQQIMEQQQLGAERLVLSCPYCYGVTAQGETFCCELLLKAFEAILEAQTTIDNIETAQRAVEAWHEDVRRRLN